MQIQIPLQALTINQAWKGRRFKSSDYRLFEHDVKSLLPRAKETLTGPVIATYEYGLKSKQFLLCDVGNMEKCLSDILVKLGYIEDDRNIRRLIQEKVLSTEFYIKVRFEPFA